MPSLDAAKVPFASRQPSRRVAEPVAVKRIAFAGILAIVRDLPLDDAGYPLVPRKLVPLLSNAIKAFTLADERDRIARGRPLPGSLRPERKPAKRNKPRASGPVAPPAAQKLEDSSSKIASQEMGDSSSKIEQKPEPPDQQ
jgi:hypothetical protein